MAHNITLEQFQCKRRNTFVCVDARHYRDVIRDVIRDASTILRIVISSDNTLLKITPKVTS